MLQGVFWERVHEGTLGLPNFRWPVAQTLLARNSASTVFEMLDPFSMTEFIVTRPEGADHRD